MSRTGTNGAARPKAEIDRGAEEAQIVGAITDTGDVPMPTVENAAASVFRPGAGISAADVAEITLMYLLILTGSPVRVAPGALRHVQMPADRVAELSDSARRFMAEVEPSLPASSPAASTH